MLHFCLIVSILLWIFCPLVLWKKWLLSVSGTCREPAGADGGQREAARHGVAAQARAHQARLRPSLRPHWRLRAGDQKVKTPLFTCLFAHSLSPHDQTHYSLSPHDQTHYSLSPHDQTHYFLSPYGQTHYSLSPHDQTHYSLSPHDQTHYSLSPHDQTHYFLSLSLRLDPWCKLMMRDVIVLAVRVHLAPLDHKLLLQHINGAHNSCVFPLHHRVAPEGVNLVLDCLSGDDTNRGVSLLKPMGKYLLYGSANIVAGETKSFFSLAKSVIHETWKFFTIMALKHH